MSDEILFKNQVIEYSGPDSWLIHDAQYPFFGHHCCGLEKPGRISKKTLTLASFLWVFSWKFSMICYYKVPMPIFAMQTFPNARRCDRLSFPPLVYCYLLSPRMGSLPAAPSTFTTIQFTSTTSFIFQYFSDCRLWSSFKGCNETFSKCNRSKLR